MDSMDNAAPQQNLSTLAERTQKHKNTMTNKSQNAFHPILQCVLGTIWKGLADSPQRFTSWIVQSVAVPVVLLQAGCIRR